MMATWEQIDTDHTEEKTDGSSPLEEMVHFEFSIKHNRRDNVVDCTIKGNVDPNIKNELKKFLDEVITSQSPVRLEQTPRLSQEDSFASFLSALRGQRVVPGTTKDITSLQKRLRRSLIKRLENSLIHDWLPREKASRFSLMQYYCPVKCCRVTRKPLGIETCPLKSIDDILSIGRNEDRPTNILVKGSKGTGKTSTMAFLTLKWAIDADIPFFDLVFFISLEDVHCKDSLAQVIVSQHGQLRESDQKLIESALHGDTHKALLILDGYELYTRGANRDIDKAIEWGVGNTAIVITASGEFGNLEKTMDAVVTVEGFSEKEIVRMADKYFENAKKREHLLQQANDLDISDLLRVPLLLSMICVLFNEQNFLPKSPYVVIGILYEQLMDRSCQRRWGHNHQSEQKDLPYKLGEFAWSTLFDQSLQLSKEGLIMKRNDIIYLGVMEEVDQNNKEQFINRAFQQYAASKYITQSIEKARGIEETLNELFPSWNDIKLMEEVIAFSTRSLTDPRSLINYVFATYIEEVMGRQRSGSWEIEESERLKNEGKRSNQIALLKWLYAESRVPLLGQWNHNRHINLYNHDDDGKHSRSRDTTPLDIPSKLYQFIGIKDDVTERFPDQVGEAPESFVSILWPSPKATQPLLDICHKLSQTQPVSDLQLLGIQLPDTPEREAPVLGGSTRSIWISYCDFPANFLRGILRQLDQCVALQLFRLDGMDLQDLEHDLDQLLHKIVSHHENRDKDKMSLKIGFSHSTPTHSRRSGPHAVKGRTSAWN